MGGRGVGWGGGEIIVMITAAAAAAIIIVTPKDAVQDFSLQCPYCAANSPECILKWQGRSRVQITCNTSGAYHAQHVVCHVVRWDGSAIKLDTELKSHSC